MALVTSAASGTGLATVRALHAQGADVVVAELDLAVRVDVTDPVEVASARDTAVLALGGVDLVVNNAGFVRLGTLLVV